MSLADLPALPSTGSADALEPETPAGDYQVPADAPVAADLAPLPKGEGDGSVDTDNLQVVSRDQFTTQYTNADGRRVAKTSLTPSNVVDEKGKWAAVDDDLIATGTGWTADQSPLHPAFSSDSSRADAVSMTAQGHSWSFSLVGGAKGEASIPTGKSAPKNQLSYRSVMPGVNADYTVLDGTVKETLTVADASSAGKGSWTWRLNPGDLKPRLTDDSAVELVASDGSVVANVPTPVAWDSSGVDGKQGRAEVPLKATLAQITDDDWRYTVTADPSWLADKARAYPVSIDPSFTEGPSGLAAHKSDGAELGGVMYVGDSHEPADKYWRTTATYNNSAADGEFIEGATLAFGYANYGTGSSALSNIYAATSSCFACYGTFLGGVTIATSDVTTTGTGVGTWVVNRAKAADPNVSFLVTGTEGSTYTFKQLNSALYVQYHDYPTASFVAGSAPANLATGVSLTPTLTMSATNPSGADEVFSFRIGTDINFAQPLVYQSPETHSTSITVPEGYLKPNVHYYWRAYVRDAWDGTLGQSSLRSTGAWSFTTEKVPPTSPVGTASPGNATGLPQVLTTTTPTLQVDPVTDADSIPAGGTVKYQFLVATGADGLTGALASSGDLLPDPDGKVRWTIPDGTLKDGGIYHWVVEPTDGVSRNVYPAWVNSFKVDKRLGTTGPSPFDTAGPVTVNLANGNANLSFASPLVSTLGGSMGMSFSYNSEEGASPTTGLTGSYYDARVAGAAPSSYDFTGKPVLFTRTDPSINFDWNGRSPAPSVPQTLFMARWQGFIKAPSAGNYTFGVTRDDGARLYLNGSGTATINQWSGSTPVTNWATSATAMPATAIPITLEYYQVDQTSQLKLWVKDPTGKTFIVPSSWLSTKIDTLPDGWSSSTTISGSASSWASARVTESAIVLTDATGGVHSYAEASAGGYTPPPGETGTVSLDSAGLVVFTDADGTVYHFTKEGKVATSTAPADGLKPAAPQSVVNANGQVTEIDDPVSKDGSAYDRKVTLTYQNSAGTACPTMSGTGYATAPVDMLCKLQYPDGSNTSIYYNGDGNLAAIMDPGNELSTFGYSDGLLSEIRDSVANDAIAAGLAPSDSSKTQITYTAGKATAVTLPAPDGATSADRPARTYTYGTGTTAIVTAGLSGTAHVAYDDTWRQTSTTSPMGATATQVWADTKDLLLSSTNAAGKTSTVVYDPISDRPTDAYGPAPSACFQSTGQPVADPVGTTNCGILPAHTATTYDGGMVGLQAAYYANKTLSGQPGLFALGIDTGDDPGMVGKVDRPWGTASPGTGIPADNWSLRLTGTITFTDPGTYTLQTVADGSAAVWLDDVRNINGPALTPEAVRTTPGTTVTVSAGETQRIRVEYADGTGNAQLALQWKTPGATGFIDVPAAQLHPDYGLVTQTTADDSTTVAGAAAPSVTASTTYDPPWLGAATDSTVDPSGAVLKTSVTYEQPGTSGWLRKLSRALPAATTAAAPSTAKTTYSYYGDLAAAPAVCGISAGTKEFGALESTTGPTPASGSPITTHYAYDSWGRVVGTKTDGDTDWSCTTYDARGRVTTQTVVGLPGTTARTATTTYTATTTGMTVATADGAVSGSTNGSTITTTSDLLGRTTSYTDVWDTVTAYIYHDVSGRLDRTETTKHGDPSPIKTEYTYDNDGKILTETVGGQVLATPDWNDSTGELNSVTYLGGSKLNSVTRDAAGRTTGQQWTFPSATTIDDTADRSQSGRVVRETLTRGATTYASTYAYDTAGRLTTATIPGHTLTYGFASTGGCGVNTAAGMSGNRTSLTDAYTAPGTSTAVTTSTAYCYDWADRLTSSTVTGGGGSGGGGGSAPALTLDGSVSKDATTASASVTATGLTTTQPGDTILAFVSADGPGPTGTQQATVTGAGLTWSLVARKNSQPGTSEVWKATATSTLSGASVTSTLQSSGFNQSLTVRAYSGAAGVGASASGSAATGAPSVSLVTTGAGSIVLGVGNDWDAATPRTVGSGQTVLHEYAPASGDDFWVQTVNSPIAASGATQVLNDTAPTADRWNLVAVEVLAATTGGGGSAATPNSVSDGLAPTDIVYDTQGNITTLADMTFTYDAAGLHASTSYTGGATDTVTRDATGRIVSRTVHPATGPDVTTRMLYSGAGDGAWGQLTGTLLSRSVVLPGGVTYSSGTTSAFTYPSLLDHTLTTGDGATTGTGVRLYDPYGQPLDPSTLAIGTDVSDDQVDANANSGWKVSDLKISETVGSTLITEMGARLYVPALGRFLETDPIDGGSENDYVWPTDPIGSEDLAGTCVMFMCDDGGEGGGSVDDSVGLRSGSIYGDGGVGETGAGGRSGGITPVRAGQDGEAAVKARYGDLGPKSPIRTPSGKTYIPDGLDKFRKILSEVKNVKTLSNTRQIRAFAEWAYDNDYEFDLYVRNSSTHLSQPLKDTIAKYNINVEYIYGGP